MVRHNNIIPNQHFHKKWARRVKTWFAQPMQKKVRRNLRKEKAAAAAPAPVSGSLRPLVQCPTRKYNTKQKLGRGFTLDELRGAGINPKLAVTVGISVDHRRTNKSEESFNLNVNRLKDFKARLVVFPKRNGAKYTKKGDASAADVAAATQFTGELNAVPKKSLSAVTVGKVTDEMKDFKAYYTLRNARNEARLMGTRDKKKRDAEKDSK
jgi:large subunit ribosomal protein L13e